MYLLDDFIYANDFKCYLHIEGSKMFFFSPHLLYELETHIVN